MKKTKVYLFFVALTLSLVLSGVIIIRSQWFLNVLRTALIKIIPKDLGMQIRFDSVGLGFFPPSIALEAVEIHKDQPLVHLRAKSISVEFGFVQLFSRHIQIDALSVESAQVTASLNVNHKDDGGNENIFESLSWDLLGDLPVRSVKVSDSKVSVFLNSNRDSYPSRFELDLKRFSISKNQKASSKSMLAGKSNLESGVLLECAIANPHIDWKSGGDHLSKTGSKRKSILPSWFEIADVASELNAKVSLSPSVSTVTAIEVIGPVSRLLIEGQLNGDALGLLQGKNNELSLDLKAHSFVDFANISEETRQLIGTEGQWVPDSGQSDLVLKASAKFSTLESLKANLNAEANLQIHDLDLASKSFFANSIQSEISFKEKNFRIRSLQIEGPNKECLDGLNPGSGGLVRLVAPVTIPLKALEIFGQETGHGSDRLFDAEIELKDAHDHWLVFPAIKKIYPLQFRANGRIKLALHSDSLKKFRLLADLDIIAKDLVVKTYKYLDPSKDVTTILEVPNLTLTGSVEVNSFGFFPNVQAKTGNTTASMSGQVDFKSGEFGLVAKLKIVLDELKKLAEQDIRGHGDIEVDIHGPADDLWIDFILDIEDGYFVNLNLGHVTGLIALEEGPMHLFLRNSKGKVGTTEYQVNGRISLGDSDTWKEGMQILLDVDVPKGDIHDVLTLTGDLTKDIWWFPHTLKGETKATATLSGQLDLKKLVIESKFRGTGWQYIGERFKDVDFSGVFDKGHFAIRNLRVEKKFALLKGGIEVTPDESISWQLDSNRLTASDFDWVLRQDVPFRSNIELHTKGEGAFGSIRSESRVIIDQISLRREDYDSCEINVQSKDGRTDATGHLFGDQATFSASFDSRTGQKSHIMGQANRLDLSPLLLLVNSKLVNDEDFRAYITGNADITYNQGSVEFGQGTIQLEDFLVSKVDESLRLVAPSELKFNRGDFTEATLELESGDARTTIRLKGQNAIMDVLASGKVNFGLLEFVSPVFDSVRGLGDISVHANGPFRNMKVDGNVKLDKVQMNIAASESPIENLRGNILIKQNVFSTTGIDGAIANGLVSLKGQVSVFPDRMPELNVEGTLKHTRVKVFPFQYITVSGGFFVTGSEFPYLISGSSTVENALTTVSFRGSKKGEAIKTTRFLPGQVGSSDSDTSKFVLKIKAKAEGGVFGKNEIINAEGKGEVTLVGSIQNPRLLGHGELVQGQMLFKDHVFQIDSAKVEFDSPTVFNPKFSVNAITEVQGVKVSMFSEGRSDKFKVEVSSNPPMPENEILSLLALGLTSSDKQRLGSSGRSAVESGEGLSLLLHSLEFNKNVEEKTGLQIELKQDEAKDSNTSISRAHTDSSAGTSPKIVIKKQILKNIDLSWGTSVGDAKTRRKEVNAEYKVTPGFSVLGAWDNFEEGTVNQDSFGLDLKFQKRFK